MFDINKEMLSSIENDWKSIPQIAQELDVNVMRVHKHMKSFEKMDMVMCMYGEKRENMKGKIPMVYKRR